MNHLVLFSRHCLASLVLLWRPILAKPLAGTTLAKEQAEWARAERAVATRCMRQQRAPATTDVEVTIAGLHLHVLAHGVELAHLRGLE